MSRRITRSSVINNRVGQGRVWQLSSSNQELMNSVFSQCGLSNLSGQRLNFAVASFNRAFSQDRNNQEQNLAWFKSLMGVRN